MGERTIRVIKKIFTPLTSSVKSLKDNLTTPYL